MSIREQGDTAMTAPTTPVTVTVRLFAGAAAALGTRETTVEATTVRGALEALLAGASAEARTVVERSSLLVNAVSCRDQSTALRAGDRLDVLPPFAGG